MKKFEQAVCDWELCLGKENVICDDEKVLSYETATFSTSQKILAVICPKNSMEVVECVKIANTYKIPIYPISCGKNWGYGSRVPVSDRSVILDLNRMNRIIEFNKNFAYITVEPGVTFLQVIKYLKRKKTNLTITTGGGSSHASLIGNAAERGIGKGIYGNRFESMCGLEVVLPTGECIHTGFDNLPSSKTGKLSKTGLGPFVDGLFTQSNLGIITKATFWLLPKPHCSLIFSFLIKDASKLTSLIDVLRVLKLEGAIKGNFLLSNNHRVLAIKEQYPWDEMKGKVPLSFLLLQKISKKLNIGEWNGEATISANSKEELNLIKFRVEKSLKKIVDELYFSEETFFSDMFLGISIRSLYWRKKTPIPKKMDPDRDLCGALWISPAVPLKGRPIVNVLNLMKKDMYKFGFEANLGVNFISDRLAYITGAIIYDREIKGEDEKAILCYHQLLKKLAKNGIYPYRLGINSMNVLPKPYDDYSIFLTKLKKALDPNNILSQGRYDYREENLNTYQTSPK